MSCQTCKSDKILSLYAKSSDCNNLTYNNVDYHGYLPIIPNLCGGDDVDMNICLSCGQVQGTWPAVWDDSEFDQPKTKMCTACDGSGLGRRPNTNCLECDATGLVVVDDDR